MAYNDAILGKHGPLARVWLAAHWERKLSKAQWVQTSVPECVAAIVQHGEEEPLALRLSGPLLLGVVRVYARKTKYLQDDCNDTLVRIKGAFRNGSAAVDMSQEQLHLSRSAITLPMTSTPWDLLMPEPSLGAWASMPRASAAHTARVADITLPEAQYAMAEDVPPVADVSMPSTGGMDTSLDLDLGLEHEDLPGAETWRPSRSAPRTKRPRREPVPRADPWAAPPGADDSLASVGVARDADVQQETDAERVRSLLGDVSAADSSIDAFTGTGDLPPLDDEAQIPAAAAASSPALPPRSATPPRDVAFDESIAALGQLTPSTAAKLRSAASHRAAGAGAKGSRKRPIQDAVTEMQDAGRVRAALQRAAANNVRSAQEHMYLPASRTHLALMEAQQHGRGTDVADSTWGALASELGPLLGSGAAARRTLDAEQRKSEMQQWLWRIREEARQLSQDAEEDEYPAEVARRAPEAPEESLDWLRHDTGAADKSLNGFDVSMGDTTAGADGDLPPLDVPDISQLDDTAPEPMQVDQAEATADETQPELRRSSRHRAETHDEPEEGRLPPLTRLSTPDEEGEAPSTPELGALDVPVPDTNPLEAFETRQREPRHDDAADGLDASTRRAMHILRTKMGEGEAGVSMDELSAHASRRAAAGFFFELLVLGTKDCVRLEQDEPYGDVHVHGKPRFWEL